MNARDLRMFSAMRDNAGRSGLADHYAALWGLGPLRALDANCGDVFTDGERLLKIPHDPVLGRLEVRGLRRFAATADVPRVHADDPATGAFVEDYVAGVHPHVVDHLPAIRSALDGIHRTRVGRYARPSPWPRHIGPATDEMVQLVVDAWKHADWGRNELGPLVWMHGDPWSRNLVLRPDGSVAAIDPIPTVGYALYDVAELVSRTITYQDVGDTSVVERTAVAFELDVNRLRAATRIAAAASAARNDAGGRPENRDAYLAALSALEPRTLAPA